ncbi:IS66 family transposase zinc-finger binding domain-containing protein [Erwinia rhapontici]|uniref:IS66 family transposase zinc-finger binding domain-containing protein n=1 Tax=Erwinia rhapontici TaxID=55212 RepID=UPI0013319799|nr:IS66 family transposase zinc-finger binding domain-containing protein [Erwinia rhapontici]MBP2154263.1 hypothetical protein [Erwinia rhapontici]
MKTKNHALPTEVPALQALVLQHQESVAQLQATVASMHDDLNSRKAEIDRLQAQLAKLRRLYFGRSSEKAERQIVQLEHRLQALLTEDNVQSARVDDPAVPPASRRLPAHLPREERCLEPHEPACPACGGDLKPLCEDVSEQLELIKSAFKVIKTRRKKKACARCDVIVQAPAPSRPIERDIAGRHGTRLSSLINNGCSLFNHQLASISQCFYILLLDFFTGTKWMPGRNVFSQISSASLASFFLMTS